MDNTPTTLDDRHPEDAIFETATFLRKLSEVQTIYFEKLLENLQLNDTGEQHLFEYIFNTQSGDYEDFAHYLETLGLAYDASISKIGDYAD
jgi:hypothetical protein